MQARNCLIGLILSIVGIFLCGCGPSAWETQYKQRHANERAAYMSRLERSSPIRAAIAEKRILIGMTKEEVELAIGEPFPTGYQYYKRVDSLGTWNNWDYGYDPWRGFGYYENPNRYKSVSFHNGKVISFSQ